MNSLDWNEVFLKAQWTDLIELFFNLLTIYIEYSTQNTKV